MTFLTTILFAAASAERMSEFKILPGHTVLRDVKNPEPHEYPELQAATLPTVWDWGNINGTNHLTGMLNQHIPQYCGSCWAHGAMSSFADRIKIARMKAGLGGPDIAVSIQYILNCGGDMAGSCHGGSATGAFQFVKSKHGGVPFRTCNPYLACSSESKDGMCPHVDTTCTAANTCKTCSTFKASGGVCNPIEIYPNATISEYSAISPVEKPGQMGGFPDPRLVQKLKAELFARGPLACGVNANKILEYQGGIIDMPTAGTSVDHIVSITGWGNENGVEYWMVRNSWGEYWGELGFFRIKTGSNQLGIERTCSWATPEVWTEKNFACFEGGENCLTHNYAHPGPSHMDYRRSVREQLKSLRA